MKHVRKKVQGHSVVAHSWNISDTCSAHAHTVHPLQMADSHTDKSYPTNNPDGDMENTSEESDDDVSKLDVHIQRQIKHVLRLAEWAARTTQDFRPSDVEAQSVQKQIGDLRFYALASKSASWMPKFETMINFAHSARITKLTPALKLKLREGGQKYYTETGFGSCREGDFDRCAVCNTKEHNARWCIDLACNPDWTSYDARQFLNKPNQWGMLYDKAWKQHSKIFEDDWAPTDDMNMPREFMGSFAVGDTCLKHITTVLATQNMPFDTIYSAMSLLRDKEEESNNGQAPDYQDLCTVTDERVLQWYTQTEHIQFALSTSAKTTITTTNKPLLQYCEELWAKIDCAITQSIGTKSMSALYKRCGYWAARNMHKASQIILEPSNSCKQKYTKDTPKNQRRDWCRRHDKGNVSKEDDEEHNIHINNRLRKRVQRIVDESDSDHASCELEHTHSTTSCEPYTKSKPKSTYDVLPKTKRARFNKTIACSSSSSSSSHDASSSSPIQQPLFSSMPVQESIHNPLSDLASAASNMRALVSGSSPQDRLLRGYATSIAQLFDLGRVLTDKGMHVEAGVAGRGAIVLQELACKYQDQLHS